jgi:molecular chaperone GrpE
MTNKQMSEEKKEKEEKEKNEVKKEIKKQDETEQTISKEQEYLDNWKRALADFENYKKDQARRMEEFRKFTKIDFVMQVLPVLDNFHASTDHIPDDQKNSPWVTGIMHIQKQLEDVLKDNGAEEIPVKVGDEFDPAMHEAVHGDTKKTNNDTKETNKIVKIVRKGYKIDGKVIRAAKVIVN